MAYNATIQKYHKNKKSVKCIFCSVWIQNIVWNFKGAFRNSYLYTAKYAFYEVYIRYRVDMRKGTHVFYVIDIADINGAIQYPHLQIKHLITITCSQQCSS